MYFIGIAVVLFCYFALIVLLRKKRLVANSKSSDMAVYSMVVECDNALENVQQVCI